VLLERDQNVPDLDTLLDEVAAVRAVCERAATGSAGPPSEHDASRAQVRQ